MLWFWFFDSHLKAALIAIWRSQYSESPDLMLFYSLSANLCVPDGVAIIVSPLYLVGRYMLLTLHFSHDFLHLSHCVASERSL